jgi:high-affinity K+ transport system ATPase subunit B
VILFIAVLLAGIVFVLLVKEIASLFDSFSETSEYVPVLLAVIIVMAVFFILIPCAVFALLCAKGVALWKPCFPL